MHGNPMAGPLAEKNGLIVLENPDGHQSWALIVDAQIRYDGDVTISPGEAAQSTLIVTLKPGELLRAASTDEPGEENVLVYSRLLVGLLREERERYAELERTALADMQGKLNAERAMREVERDRDEQVRRAWRHGAAQGWFHGQPMQGKTLDEVLAECPHPDPDDDETDGCHVCGGPDH